MREDEMDHVVRDVRGDTAPMTDESFAANREKVLALAAAGRPAGRPARRWWGVAAGVAALAAGGVLAQVALGGPTPATAEAAQALTRAADAITTTDPVLGPGQYRYAISRGRSAVQAQQGGQDFRWLGEEVLEVWLPAVEGEEYLVRPRDTGRRDWLVGTEEQARNAGVDLRPASQDEVRGRCDRQCQEDPGAWQQPNARFMAGLPRAPEALLERLLADGRGRGSSDHQEALVLASDLLRSGKVPAELRAALFRALALLPGLEVVDQSANLDGRRGVALAVTDGDDRQEVIVDPATGEFIGDRRVLTESDGSLPAGTVVESASVTTAVVDGIGVRP
ncbi:CU044_5270 family protein [Actinosynnema sp. NPDC091369]